MKECLRLILRVSSGGENELGVLITCDMGWGDKVNATMLQLGFIVIMPIFPPPSSLSHRKHESHKKRVPRDRVASLENLTLG